MFKSIIIIMLVSIISSCSNNKIVNNPVTGEKPNPGLFSKDANKVFLWTPFLIHKIMMVLAPT